MLAVMQAKRASVATVPAESRIDSERSERPGWRVASHRTARTAQAARWKRMSGRENEAAAPTRGGHSSSITNPATQKPAAASRVARA